MNTNDWSIQEIARLAGTTSRTLRHYDDIGLLAPSRVAHNGYRHYDQTALVRLQRILLLRELGLGLPRIGEVLDAPSKGSGNGHAAAETSALDALVRTMIEQRAQARADKDWVAADRIRDAIAAAGITLEDTPAGTHWSIDG